VPRDVTLLAPVQQAGSALTVEVANLADKPSAISFARYAWPALLALAVWVFGWITDRQGPKTAGSVLGWTLLAWAALRCPNGATIFFAVLAAFLVLEVVIPALRRLWRLPRQPLPVSPPAAQGGAAPAVTALLVGGLVWVSLTGGAYALGYSDGSFPLTPTLSLGERENSWPALEKSVELAHSPVLHAAKPAGAAGTLIARNDSRQALLSPLPEGEGWGEGEQRVRSATRPWLLAQASTPATRKASRLQIGDTADYRSALPAKDAPMAESVTQDIRIEDKFALATAAIRWQAEKGDMLPLLFEPTVLTRLDYPTNTLELMQATAGSRTARQLLARKSGTFDIKLQYQLPVNKADGESGIVLPVPPGLINRLNLIVANLDVDVFSPQAVSIRRGALARGRSPRCLEAAQPRHETREAGLLCRGFPALRARRRRH
jgi:hypothetical protein